MKILNENLQQARKLLKKLNISEDDPRYDSLRKLVGNNMGYMGLFTKFVFVEKISIEDIKNLYADLKKYKQNLNTLRYPVHEYPSFEMLIDDIQIIESFVRFNSVVSELPSKLKEYARKSGKYKNIIDSMTDFQLNQYINIFIKPKVSSFRDIDDLIENTISFLKLYQTEKNIIDKINGTDGASIIYHEDRIVVAEIFTEEASKVLGSNSWCIVRGSWAIYMDIEKVNRQYFVWNFQAEKGSVDYMLGTTIKYNGAVVATHLMDDSSGNLSKYCDEYGIDIKIFKPYGGVVDVDYVINYIKRYSFNGSIYNVAKELGYLNDIVNYLPKQYKLVNNLDINSYVDELSDIQKSIYLPKGHPKLENTKYGHIFDLLYSEEGLSSISPDDITTLTFIDKIFIIVKSLKMDKKKVSEDDLYHIIGSDLENTTLGDDVSYGEIYFSKQNTDKWGKYDRCEIEYNISEYGQEQIFADTFLGIGYDDYYYYNNILYGDGPADLDSVADMRRSFAYYIDEQCVDSLISFLNLRKLGDDSDSDLIDKLIGDIKAPATVDDDILDRLQIGDIIDEYIESLRQTALDGVSEKANQIEKKIWINFESVGDDSEVSVPIMGIYERLLDNPNVTTYYDLMVKNPPCDMGESFESFGLTDAIELGGGFDSANEDLSIAIDNKIDNDLDMWEYQRLNDNLENFIYKLGFNKLSSDDNIWIYEGGGIKIVFRMYEIEYNDYIHTGELDDVVVSLHIKSNNGESMKAKVPVTKIHRYINQSFLKFEESLTPINENLQQARKVLKDSKIDEEDPRFQELRRLLGNNLGYLGIFTKFVIKENINLEDISNLYADLKKYRAKLKNLRFPVQEYPKYEMLLDDIQKIESYVRFNKVIQEITSKLKTDARESEEFKNIIDSMSDSKLSKYVKNYIKPKISAVKNLDELIDQTKKFIASFRKEAEVITEIENTDNAYLIYHHGGVIIAEITSEEASKKLGSSSWCITRGSWNIYMERELRNRQYFVWNFLSDVGSVDFMMGTTIDRNGEVVTSHLMNDEYVKLGNYLKKYNIDRKYFKGMNTTYLSNILNEHGFDQIAYWVMSDLDVVEKYKNILPPEYKIANGFIDEGSIKRMNDLQKSIYLSSSNPIVKNTKYGSIEKIVDLYENGGQIDSKDLGSISFRDVIELLNNIMEVDGGANSIDEETINGMLNSHIKAYDDTDGSEEDFLKFKGVDYEVMRLSGVIDFKINIMCHDMIYPNILGYEYEEDYYSYVDLKNASEHYGESSIFSSRTLDERIPDFLDYLNNKSLVALKKFIKNIYKYLNSSKLREINMFINSSLGDIMPGDFEGVYINVFKNTGLCDILGSFIDDILESVGDVFTKKAERISDKVIFDYESYSNSDDDFVGEISIEFETLYNFLKKHVNIISFWDIYRTGVCDISNIVNYNLHNFYNYFSEADTTQANDTFIQKLEGVMGDEQIISRLRIIKDIYDYLVSHDFQQDYDEDIWYKLYEGHIYEVILNNKDEIIDPTISDYKDTLVDFNIYKNKSGRNIDMVHKSYYVKSLPSVSSDKIKLGNIHKI